MLNFIGDNDMKNRCLILTGFVVVSVLLLQFGCQKQAAVSPPPAPVKVKPLELTPPSAKLPPPPPVTVEPNKPLLAPPAAEQLPKITFAGTVHDFGEVAPNSKSSCEFKFTNTGSAVLKIGKIHSSCGCTVPQLSKDEYAPGESGAITVEYHSATQGGPVARKLDVPSNDKTNQKVTLTVKALIVVKIEYEPKKLTLALKNDSNTPPQKIKIRSTDGQPFAITGFESHPPEISIIYDPNVKKTEFVLELIVDLQKLQKDLQGNIRINITYPGYSPVTIPFSVLPKFKVSPPAIVLLDAKPQEPVEREITVLSNYNEPFEIESTSTQKNIIKVLSQEKLADRCKIKVSITPPPGENNPRMFVDTLTIKIKDGGNLDVICRGFYSTGKEKSKP